MAKNDIKRNKKSNALHQLGEESQQVAEQDFAIKMNGVTIQCIIHRKLAIIPIVSVFNVYLIIIKI
jgi:hypothetical protein